MIVFAWFLYDFVWKWYKRHGRIGNPPQIACPPSIGLLGSLGSFRELLYTPPPPPPVLLPGCDFWNPPVILKKSPKSPKSPMWYSLTTQTRNECYLDDINTRHKRAQWRKSQMGNKTPPFGFLSHDIKVIYRFKTLLSNITQFPKNKLIFRRMQFFFFMI